MFNTKIQKLLDHQGGNYIFPFFWQHGESEEVLREYMRVIHESNIGAVCVESRPHPDFAGPQWWHDMDIILDEARKRDMKVWILDDSHFPTGFANGAMENQPEELCRQSLVCRTLEAAGGECLALDEETLAHPLPFEKNMVEQYVLNGPMREYHDDRLLSVSARNLESGAVIDLKGEIKDGTLRWTVPAGSWKVYLLHLSRNYGFHRNYINMMDKRSCRVLIDTVYEPHYAHYKDDFGKTIAGFFSDEPELGNGHLYDTNDPYGGPNDYPFSAELEERLSEKLGADFALQLPLLWENEADAEETARLRCAFMDAVTELVSEDFSEQLGAWCRDHGVQYIGHLIEDDNHHSRTGSSLGHYFRGLSGQDMAGVDDIGGQVFPQGEDISYNNGTFMHRDGEFYHYLLGKLADSAAAIEPRKQGNTMCEIFGNYGWEEGVRLEKYLADHFLVRGINHFVPHAFSGKEYPDPDCPPHFYAHGNNPQYRHFGCLMAYMNRVCELLSGGRHIAPASVLYTAEGDWTGKYMTVDKVAHRLVDAQMDYDVIPSDVFADRVAYHTLIENGTLKVNTQAYRAFIIPSMQFIPGEVAQAVVEMQKAGVAVYMIDALPEGICRGEAEVPEMEVAALDDLVETLEAKQIRDVRIEPANNRIRYRHYVHEDGTEVFFLVNEGTEVYNGEIVLPEITGKTVYAYDPWNNTILGAEKSENHVFLRIEPLHSITLVADPTAVPEELPAAKDGLCDEATEITLEGPWLRSICRSIDYPAFTDEKEIELPDNLAEEAPKFSGYVRYRNTFEAAKGERICLEITDAHEGVEVFVNGESLGIQIVPPFRYDLSGALKDGLNELTIEVATTLDRENSGKPDHFGRVKEATALSGITGRAVLKKVID